MYPEFKKNIIWRAFAIIVIFLGITVLLGFGFVGAVAGQTNSASNKISADNRTTVTARAVLERELDLGTGPEGLIAKCPRSGGGGRGGGSRGGGFGFSYANTMNVLNNAWRDAVAAQNAHFNQVEREAERLLNEPTTDIQSGTERITSSPGGSSKKKTSSGSSQQQPPTGSTSESQRGNIDPVWQEKFKNMAGMKPFEPDNRPRWEQGYKKDLAQDPSPEEPMVTWVTSDPAAGLGTPFVTDQKVPQSVAVATKNLENSTGEFVSNFLPPAAELPQVTKTVSEALGEGDYGKAAWEAFKHGVQYIPGNPGKVIGVIDNINDIKGAGDVPLGKAAEDFRDAHDKYGGKYLNPQ